MTASRDGRIVTFYSYKGGTGRTMALANTAWILAANGKRVLAVDWDLEAPGLHRFFHPFLDPSTLGATTGVIDLITEYAWAATSPVQRADDWHRDYARIQPHAVSLAPEALGWEFPQGGTLDFVSAGRQNREYSATVSTFDWDNFYDRLGGGHFFDALRDDMKANYDYVLIDSRTGLSDIADICTVHLPDVLVDCFTLSDQSIDGAASVARQISERYTGRPISIFPVPMRIDEGEKEKADAYRALARLKFDRLPRDLSGDELTAYWGAVEIPYRPYYAYEETLATFGDEVASPTRCSPPSNASPPSSPTSRSPRCHRSAKRYGCASGTRSPGAGPRCRPISSSAMWRRTGCGPTGSSPCSPGPGSASYRATCPPSGNPRNRRPPRTPPVPWCCSPAPTSSPSAR